MAEKLYRSVTERAATGAIQTASHQCNEYRPISAGGGQQTKGNGLFTIGNRLLAIGNGQ